MPSNESFAVSQGSSLTIAATLVDALGNPLAGLDGTEVLTTVVWPGGNRAVSFSPATTFVVPADATATVVITAAESQGLEPARYRVATTVTASGQDPIDGYSCYLDVAASPGTEAAPKAYTTYADLLRYGRSWLRTLQTDDDESGFAEQQGRARSWIGDIAQAHYGNASMQVVIGGDAFGPRDSGARSTWLDDQLDCDKLMVTDAIREACAKKALAYICEGQVGVSETSVAYARLARMYHSQADSLGCSTMLQLDTDGDGFADLTIDPSCHRPRYG